MKPQIENPASFSHMTFSSGLIAFDDLIGGVLPGDNFVWHVDNFWSFTSVARIFAEGARKLNHDVVYFQWNNQHPASSIWSREECLRVKEHNLKTKLGFEKFITEMHTVIEESPEGTIFVFDLLSDLIDNFRAEQSLENFFVLTCPFILQLKHIGIFPILRDRHPYSTARPIQETTQVDVDLFNHDGALHLHLRKVDNRYTDLMYSMHRWEGEQLLPLLNSVDTVSALHSVGWAGLQSASYRMILRWDREFMNAEEYLISVANDSIPANDVPQKKQAFLKRLVPLIITREPQMQRLFEKYFSLEDIVYVWKRTIGTGMIGGKAAGMLLARAIIRAELPTESASLEPHDSFFIASDVYYDFLIKNNCWRIQKKQRCRETLFEDAAIGRERILNGAFSPEIMQRYSDMLGYFGQEPIIVRSSSLLEDAYQNAFAGKYESVFCSNQGTPTERLNAFINAVRTVYASTMSDDALAYRGKRDLLEQDEQMGILVQRVSGTRYGHRFFPHIAGVGLSYNPYIWDPQIDPDVGVLRLVVGLGTRAVDRHDDDHARIVALNVPQLSPLSNEGDANQYTQIKVDVVDLSKNQIHSKYFVDLVNEYAAFPSQFLASVDTEVENRQRETGHRGRTPWMVDFSKLFRCSCFTESLKSVLSTLKKAYGTDVEIEFTSTVQSDNSIRLNIVQCRPFQISLNDQFPKAPERTETNERHTVLKANGAILGKSRHQLIDRIIFVVPEAYSILPEQQKYQVAQLIGQLTELPASFRCSDDDKGCNVALIGPGRWGTRMPSLGVPITSSSLGHTSVMCELDIMHEGLIPDLSLGTHFFHELVESNILYIGYFSDQQDNHIDLEFFAAKKNQLETLLPAEGRWAQTVRVIDCDSDMKIGLSADLHLQSSELYFFHAKKVH
ncbi:MAG: pyruvate, phosphate dikinase [Deltaproteobacteria bacterium]|nr:pyruvate, phosphate dikinase [Deltaproteobacteria bacterium]